MQLTTNIQKRNAAKSGIGGHITAYASPKNKIILEKSFAYMTRLKIQEKALKTLFSEDPQRRETSAKMIFDEG